jgi:hypothetical protein
MTVDTDINDRLYMLSVSVLWRLTFKAVWLSRLVIAAFEVERVDWVDCQRVQALGILFYLETIIVDFVRKGLNRVSVQ